MGGSGRTKRFLYFCCVGEEEVKNRIVGNGTNVIESPVNYEEESQHY